MINNLFIGSQSVYAGVNAVNDSLFVKESHLVEEKDDFEEKPITVMLPAYREHRWVLEDSLNSLEATSYDQDKLDINLIYEEDDDIVAGYVRELEEDYGIGSIEVKEEDGIWEEINDAWLRDNDEFPRNKARALNYALFKEKPDNLVTVLDSDTVVPENYFSAGISGMKDFDLVQTKQTVRNTEDGWLPKQESMGMSAWSSTIFEKLGDGQPNQLLGKGYFMDGEDLLEMEGWNPYSATEDMELGIRAYKNDMELGVIDEYVEDLCPSDWGDWKEQKRRWLAGPWENFSELNLKEKAQLYRYTLNNQLMTLNNVVGVPTGANHAYNTLTGTADPSDPLFMGITLFNLANFAWYSYQTIKATESSIDFDSRKEKAKYYGTTNPITQVAYSTAWAVPVGLALKDIAKGETEFNTTPKQPSKESEQEKT